MGEIVKELPIPFDLRWGIGRWKASVSFLWESRMFPLLWLLRGENCILLWVFGRVVMLWREE